MALRAITVPALLVGVLSCAAPTGYERDGYSVRRVGSDHYEVAFTGNPNMELQEVKNRVMRRAAEVTLKAGYSHLVIYTNSAQADISAPNDPFWNSENGYLSGLVRRGGTGFHSDAPEYQGSGEANINTRYTASSEIIVLKDEQAARNPDALSAQAILDRFTSSSASETKR